MGDGDFKSADLTRKYISFLGVVERAGWNSEAAPHSVKLGRNVKASLYGLDKKHLEGYHELVQKLEISTIERLLSSSLTLQNCSYRSKYR